RAGLILGMCTVAAAVHAYGRQVRAASAAASPDDGTPSARWVFPARCALAVGASFAVIAPILVRNGGHALPQAGVAPAFVLIVALALVVACVLVVPIALTSVYACDIRGPLPPRVVLRALARHPMATLLALFLVPLALILTEGLVALVSWHQ